MNKFTKSLVAVAVSALVAGPAFGETWSGSKAQVKFSGSGCKADKAKNLDMNFYAEGGTSGPNSGFWESSIFSFDGLVGGEGTFTVSKTGKTIEDAPKMATNDLFWDEYYALEDAMADYSDGCKDADGYNYDTLIKKFDTKWSKDGEKAKVQMQAEGTYENTKGKSKKIKLKVNSGEMDQAVF